MTRLVLLLSLIATITLGASARVLAAGPPMTISGGDLPRAVQVTPVDAAAFARRLNLPPLLDNAPELTGESYTVVSAYWDIAIRDNEAGRPLAEDTATYYPVGGFVRGRQGGEDVWLVIDIRQRAILDRYIRLVKANAIGPQPNVLELLKADFDATAVKAEVMGVQAGSIQLTVPQIEAFWGVAGAAKRLDIPAAPDFQAPSGGGSSLWLIFGLPEGRSIAMLYTLGSGTLVERSGSEVYAVPRDWLLPVLGSEAPQAGNVEREEVVQEAGAGSLLWWPLMLGLGLGALGAAVWLSRRFAAMPR